VSTVTETRPEDDDRDYHPAPYEYRQYASGIVVPHATLELDEPLRDESEGVHIMTAGEGALGPGTWSAIGDDEAGAWVQVWVRYPSPRPEGRTTSTEAWVWVSEEDVRDIQRDG